MYIVINFTIYHVLEQQLCCPSIAHWTFKWSGFFPISFRKHVTACLILLRKTRLFIMPQIMSTIYLSSISHYLFLDSCFFQVSHLPPYWHGHTLVQKKKVLWQKSHIPVPHHHLPVCLICSLLVMRLSSGTLPTTGCPSTQWLLLLEVWIFQSDLIRQKNDSLAPTKKRRKEHRVSVWTSTGH